MRKGIIFFSLIVWATSSVACDFCNCYLGINPHYKKNSLGVRYTQSSYFGSHSDKSELMNYNLSPHDFRETRSNIEVYSQFYPIQKLQIQVYVPYVINKEYMSDAAFEAFSSGTPNGSRLSHQEPAIAGSSEEFVQANTIQGMGDPLLLAHYQLFNLNTSDSLGFKQRLLVGGGIKFPFGKSFFYATEDPLEKTHQPGSGSWDVLPSLAYLGKYKKLGMNLNVSYRIITQDKYHIQLSNRVNANLNIYRQVTKRDLFVYPSLGVYLEQAGRTTYGVKSFANSGGTLLFGHVGADLYFRKIAFSAAIHFPTLQKLNGMQPRINYRLIFGLSYSLN